MANPEHREILMQGVDAWNKWRRLYPEIRPDLSHVSIINADLINADLSNADLSNAYLHYAKLNRADLSNATLGTADLHCSSITDADLRGANLHDARLYRSLLFRSNLSGAEIHFANLNDVHFAGADFTNAEVGHSSFGNNDLSQVKGLETVTHTGPSTIGIDTIYKSRGKIPEIFLRGCGVPESFIAQIPALVAALGPIQFYSCFISYSSKDQSFADRLYADLQNKGVRCWFAPHDLPIGARIRPAIDESIRVHDKLLLVLSEASVSSQWVEQEVETALAREREQEGKTVLFPIRVDDAIMGVRSGWPALLRNTRNVGDFTSWKDHDSYSKAFDRLLRDLKAEA